MSALNKKVQFFKNWCAINKKTIVTSCMIVIIGVYLIGMEAILAFISFILYGIVYLLPNNSSVAAFWGAFFAFIFMRALNIIERNKLQKERSVIGLQKVNMMLEEHLFYLSGNLDLLETQIQLLTNEKMVYCKSSPFLSIEHIDQDLILQIENEQLRNRLLYINRQITAVNHCSKAFNIMLASDRTTDGKYFYAPNGAKTEIKKELADYDEAIMNRKANIKYFTSTKEIVEEEIQSIR